MGHHRTVVPRSVVGVVTTIGFLVAFMLSHLE
jgi:hypothetical protein